MCCQTAQINHRTKMKVVLESCGPHKVNKKSKNIYFFYFRGISGPPKCPNIENNPLNKIKKKNLLGMDHSFPKLPLFLICNQFEPFHNKFSENVKFSLKVRHFRR